MQCVKKDLSGEAAPKYDPVAVEKGWYEWWVSQGYFRADNTTNKERFVMMIPPPNVTGSLHIGHALTVAVEDCLSRWHRMLGHEVLWLPGLDHAGIATQVVVESRLHKATGQTRHDLGREAFLKKVWEWKETSGGNIFNQMKRLAISADWDRVAFTMDDRCSAAVKEAFIRMSKSGKIFRATRMINWDCVLNTAVSNIEVDYVELDKKKRLDMPGYDKPVLFGAIWEFAYRVVGSNEEVVVATTRPETMLGDTAVAVHPDDARYKHLIGKTVQHPFCKRELPIIADPVLVQMGVGTGAVKITPSHDPNDFECGKRHNLAFINILNDNGTVNQEGGEFAGMHRWAVREKLVIRLKELGLYRDCKDHKMSLGMCSRSKDVIEFLVKPQWFVDCKEMAAKASEAVRSGELKIHPSSFEITWQRWMENTGDWCISRQLWWGHRIPAYLVHIKGRPAPDATDAGAWVVADGEDAARKEAAAKFGVAEADIERLEQDPDVLDTWFSSALFPFSTLGWPNNTADMKAFYPGTLLETGWDILFFWVAKMVFFAQELTGQLPFKHVFLHAMVRDAEGNKMSKQVGNVIDPIDVIEGATLEALADGLRKGNLDPAKVEAGIKLQRKMYGPTEGIPQCGSDGLRFALCNYVGQGRNINLNVRVVQSKRNFCDKLWNIVRFAALSIPAGFVPADSLADVLRADDEPVDCWILSTLARTAKTLNQHLEAYEFFQATDALESWWRLCLADVYLEAIKPRTKGTNDATRLRAAHVLHTCLDLGLRLTHVFMPFVTEELWQRLPRRKGDPASIMISEYPTAAMCGAWLNDSLETEMSWVLRVCQRTRAAKDAYHITRSQDPAVVLSVPTRERCSQLSKWLPVMSPLVYCNQLSAAVAGEADTKGCAMQMVDDTCQVFVRLAGLGLDYGVELQKLRKQRRQKTRLLDSYKSQMSSESYAKRPAEIREKDSAAAAALTTELEVIASGLRDFTRLMEEEGIPLPDEVVTPEVVKKKAAPPTAVAPGEGKEKNATKAAKKEQHAQKSKAKQQGKKEEKKSDDEKEPKKKDDAKHSDDEHEGKKEKKDHDKKDKKSEKDHDKKDHKKDHDKKDHDKKDHDKKDHDHDKKKHEEK